MAEWVIRARGLSKSYPVYDSNWELLKEVVFGRRNRKEIQSLRGISFEIRAGEVVGIVGRNGAGKSTLLRIVAGTLEQTSGAIEVKGKISAILELGTGFHPEFSGRENVYMGGLCLGISRKEIDMKFDEIVEFSELGAFIDQPFKTYSSGMKARLTFATAMSVDPDILIIDEALSVGDARFQKKSFSRLEKYRERGKTILFVSHDANAVTSICDRALLIDNGQLVASGDPKTVVQQYHRLLFDDVAEVQKPSPEMAHRKAQAIAANITTDLIRQEKSESRFGNGDAVIIESFMLDEEGNATTTAYSGKPYKFRMRVYCNKDIQTLVPGFVIRTPKGVDLFGIDSQWSGDLKLGPMNAGSCVDIELSVSMELANGTYFLTVAIADEDGQKFDLIYDALEIKVLGTERLFTTTLVNLHPQFSVKSSFLE